MCGFCVFLLKFYLERPSEGRIITMKTSSKKHLCIVTWFSIDLRHHISVQEGKKHT